MNSNRIEEMLDKYYNTFMERNEMQQVVITPQYVEEHRDTMEQIRLSVDDLIKHIEEKIMF